MRQLPRQSPRGLDSMVPLSRSTSSIIFTSMAIQLVTGGAGFIGSHIATGLVERGKSVRVFDNLSTGKSSNISHLEGKVEFVKADLLDRSAVLNA